MRLLRGKGAYRDVYLPKPPDDLQRGSSLNLAWYMEAFLHMLRQGWSFKAAAERLDYSYRWWTETAKKYERWADECRAAHDNPEAGGIPDLSGMTFAQFCKRYFGVELVEHQRQIVDAIEDPMAGLVLVLGFPEAGKSTLVSLWYVLYDIARDPDTRIALVAKSSSKAKDMLTRVKRYLTESQLYDGMEGNLVREFNGWKPAHGQGEWSTDQIMVRHRKSGERDPTVQALGIGKQIYGARLNRVILDDSLVMDNQISPTTRERLDTWFQGEVMSRVQRGQAIVNGTRLFPMDLYGQWKKSFKGLPTFRGVYIPAILDEYLETERPRWPEMWTLDGYMEDLGKGRERYQQGLRDIRAAIIRRDPNRWKLIYQQEDIEEEQSVFRQEHVDLALQLGEYRTRGQVRESEILILGVDPATTGRAAAVLLAYDPDTHIRTLIDIFVGSNLGAQGVRNKLLYDFWDRHRDHRIDFTVVETNFVKTLLGDEVLQQRADQAGTQIIDHHTVGRGAGRQNKWDEEYGIGALAAQFGNSQIAFASKTPEDQALWIPLIDDMLVFPYAEAQDTLIALWVANGMASFPRHRPVNQMEAMARRNVPPNIRRRAMVRAGR